MLSPSYIVLLWTVLYSGADALSPQFIQCQVQKPATTSPLTGCPAGTIFVSHNDPAAQFTSVQAAVASLPPTGAATILIGQGSYQEIVNVTRTGPLTLLGQLPSNAVAQSKPFANASSPNLNLVQIWNTNFVMTGQDDASSAVLTVAPNLAGSLIGAGTDGAPLQPVFGNSDFKAYNIDFQNRAANFAISQALVTDISYANASFYGCAFASFQDTWYTGRNASTYVVDSVIFGQTDYLFGFGTAWFQNVILANRACGGGISAWKGSNQTFAPGNRYGAYIASSQIMRSPDANATTVTDGRCFLGRPWNDLATTVYLNNVMDASINPVGFEPFDSARPTIMNTTFYAEFNSTGPGGNTSERVGIEHLLNASQAENFTVDKVFLEHPKWIDFNYLF
ncbi:pectin lyase-like protein [Roridomyces roridus]|uniref:pectinesterase n=1 Tax=Roridomyces roridus TaxID=1738132 RepID=A0AAD7FYA4_9AGAR|nr:pectin lyase-like protein [Roridomyces roridus]